MQRKRWVLLCLLLLNVGSLLGIGGVLYLQFATQKQLLTAVEAMTQRGAQNSRLLARHMIQHAKQRKGMHEKIRHTTRQEMQVYLRQQGQRARCFRLQQVGENLRRIDKITQGWQVGSGSASMLQALFKDTLSLLTMETAPATTEHPLAAALKAMRHRLSAQPAFPSATLLDHLGKLDAQLSTWQHWLAAHKARAQSFTVSTALSPPHLISQAQAQQTQGAWRWPAAWQGHWDAVKQRWPHWIDHLQRQWAAQWHVFYLPVNKGYAPHVCLTLSARLIPQMAFAIQVAAMASLNKNDALYQRALGLLSQIVMQLQNNAIWRDVGKTSERYDDQYCHPLGQIAVAMQTSIAALQAIHFSNYSVDFNEIKSLFRSQWQACEHI